ncbi:alpha/beta fold hydrolase [[Mycobacterium] burgundiense]|uniref:PHB depolymerase family esterase n=1 Tax=[Mycobacterium] burgundiense TaxID=3064286 RepID=A0ABN9N1Z6_9MYCO|nr:PHB depolymerase family esterase [Mycolicibacterium sp. MU0053]CAJ1496134.1 PHB depolymerase family esterase [Mycolicibacterium sp. MU0053]
MRPQERLTTIVRELARVLPRSVAVLSDAEGPSTLSPRGLRQLGEVALDELVVTGMTLTAAPPGVPAGVSSYAATAAELTALGRADSYLKPNPLLVSAIRRRLAGRFAFEELSYDHDPRLPQCLSHIGGSATAVCHLVRHRGGPRPWLVWVHGAGQGGLSDFAVARVGRIHRELGYNVALPVQPGHGSRRHRWPTYPDTDPVANVAGMMRTVSEVRALIRWLQPQATTIALAGLSLGSGVAALVAGLEEVDGVALYTPILGLNAMIANHLHRWGGAADEVGTVLGSPAVTELTAVIDPLTADPLPPPQRRLIVGAWHDQMAMRAPALAMHERWGGELYWHDGGHVGHLFSGKVQRVTERFLRAVAAGESR